jgi:hypothetical protein
MEEGSVSGMLAIRNERGTNPASQCVVDVKACDGANAGPCGHRHHEEEEELCTWRRKGKEGRQGVYRAYEMCELAKRSFFLFFVIGKVRPDAELDSPLAPCEW